MTKNKNAFISDKITYYCSLHITTKNCSDRTAKGYLKRKSLCNARIVYLKETNEYYLDWEHSSYCSVTIPKKYENLREINEEDKSYDKFNKSLKNFLNTYPTITLSEFIKKAYDLYYKNRCNFSIKNNTFKNLYYNWKRNSNIFTK